MSASRWENLLWPRWLPETARMPVVAQVTGAVAVTALIMGPWWSRVSTAPPATTTPAVASRPAETAAAPVTAPTTAVATATPAPDSTVPPRPAHLNLNVRHTFATVDLLVTIDGKRVVETKLEGSGKKFKMFGKRQERGFTRTLDLEPGVRLVRVNLKSPEDRFDQTRVERFELSAASVASLRINADKDAGIAASVDRPAPAKPVPAQTEATAPAAPPVAAAAIPLPAPAAVTPANQSITQQADALAELLNSLRSMLIAIAGFVASAATGFVVQEYLRSKKGVIFAPAGGGGAADFDSEEEEPAAPRKDRRRRRSQATPAIEP